MWFCRANISVLILIVDATCVSWAQQRPHCGHPLSMWCHIAADMDINPSFRPSDSITAEVPFRHTLFNWGALTQCGEAPSGLYKVAPLPAHDHQLCSSPMCAWHSCKSFLGAFLKIWRPLTCAMMSGKISTATVRDVRWTSQYIFCFPPADAAQLQHVDCVIFETIQHAARQYDCDRLSSAVRARWRGTVPVLKGAFGASHAIMILE